MLRSFRIPPISGNFYTFLCSLAVEAWVNLPKVRLYRLTSNEIAAGLKPLLIKIHPDLYGNYPDIQEVNSRSLSNLQSWLDQLNDKVPSLPKLAVSFYLKRKDNKGQLNTQLVLSFHFYILNSIKHDLCRFYWNRRKSATHYTSCFSKSTCAELT